MSRAFRFHSPTQIPMVGAGKVLRKRKPRSFPARFPLAADTSTIAFADAVRPLAAYGDLAEGESVTLTRREADLIALANPGKRPPVALEELHPWLPQQKYRDDSKRNLEALTNVLERYGPHFIAATSFCDEKWRKVCNTVGTKTDLDARFYTAWHLPIQEAYVLEERRPGRSVVAIDFNSMYSACMQQHFPDPSAMRHVVYNRNLVSAEVLPTGLFRCVLHGPTSDFINKHNPFRSFFSGRHLRASLSEPISVDLNEFEIQFLQRHFTRVFLVDAVISERSIPHPIARDVKRAFARRMHYISHGNKPLADREKYLSTLMSSCTNRPKRSRHTFSTWHSAQSYLQSELGIDLDFDGSVVAAVNWLSGRKGLSVAVTSEGIVVDVPDLRDGSACFALHQRIVARSRVLLLEMMERISTSAPDVEICYANIDSVHFSLPATHQARILEILRAEASEQMGSFKIEAVATHGLWLEPGRYWLYSNGIEKFRNRSIGRHSGPFADHAIHVASQRIGDLHIPLRTTIQMDRTISVARTIEDDDGVGLARQRLVEIGDHTQFGAVLDKFDANRMRDVPRRMRAFQDMRCHLENTASRCLGTQ